MKRIAFSILLALCSMIGYAQSERSDELFAKGVELYKTGKYKDAISFFSLCDSIDQAELDSTSNRRYYSLHWLSSCYYQMGDTAKAARLYQNCAVPPVDRRLTLESDSAAYWGKFFFENKEYEKALLWFDKCRELETAIIGGSHLYIANDYISMASCKLMLGDTLAAAHFYRTRADIVGAAQGMEGEPRCVAYSEASYVSSWAKEYEQAKTYMEKAIQMRCKLSGTDNDAYLKLLSDQEYVLKQLNDWGAAAKIKREELNIRERMTGKENNTYIFGLNDYAIYLYRVKDLVASTEAAEEVVSLYEKVNGLNNKNGIVLLENLGSCYEKENNFLAYFANQKKIAQICREFLGEESMEYANQLYILSACYEKANIPDSAFLVATQTLEIYSRFLDGENDKNLLKVMAECHFRCSKNTFNVADMEFSYDKGLYFLGRAYGKQSNEYMNALRGIAKSEYQIGLYTKSIGRLQELLELQQAKEGTISDVCARTLRDLYVISKSMKDAANIVNYAEQLYNTYCQLYGLDHVATGEAMLNLGTAYYYYAGDRRSLQGDSICKKALEVIRQADGEEGERYANAVLVFLDNEYMTDFDIPKVTAMYNEAFRVLKSKYGYTDKMLMPQINKKAAYHVVGCQFDEALDCYEPLLKLVENGGGSLSDYNALASDYCAACYYGHINDSIAKVARKVQKGIMLQVEDSFSTMAEQERNDFWQQHVDWFDDSILSYAKATNDDSLMVCAYDAQLFAKGLLLNVETAIRKIIQESGDTTLIAHLHNSNRIEAQINTMLRQITANEREEANKIERDIKQLDKDYWRIFKDKEKSNANRQKADSLNQRLRQLRNPLTEEQMNQVVQLHKELNHEQRLLVEASNRLGTPIKLSSAHTADVAAVLTPQDAAIEFVSFEDSFDIQKDSQGNPSIIPYQAYYALVLRHGYKVPHMIRLCSKKEIDDMPVSDYYTTNRLNELIWKPLEEELKGVKSIFFSPTGILHSIAIESLPNTGQDLNKYRLSSTGELIKAHQRLQHKDGKAVLYGGICYEISEEQSPIKTIVSDSFNDTPFIGAVRGAVGTIDELPGSLNEVETTAKLMQSQKINTELLTGVLADETSLKQLSGLNINVLHISTHGFYEKDIHNIKDQLNRLVSSEETFLKQQTEANSLSRSGLLLAGAANFLYGTGNNLYGEDGILTAKEISRLDLGRTNLVVLSACETGLGDITGDGVFGLQRGFKKAGANSILMSLWKVDDEATCLLMTEFYKNWIGEGKTKHDALEQAKQSVRSHKEKGWDDPKYWAAFILLDALD